MLVLVLCGGISHAADIISDVVALHDASAKHGQHNSTQLVHHEPWSSAARHCTAIVTMRSFCLRERLEN